MIRLLILLCVIGLLTCKVAGGSEAVLKLPGSTGGAEEMFSVSDPSGKMKNWRVVQSATQPAVYSVHDPATDTWRTVTDAKEIAELSQQTARLRQQSEQSVRYFQMTPQQREEIQRRKAVDLMAQGKPPAEPSVFRTVLNFARLLLLLILVVLVVWRAVLRLTSRRT